MMKKQHMFPRRLCAFAAPLLISPPRANAKDVQRDVRTEIQLLNKRDMDILKQDTMSNVVAWDVLQQNTTFQKMYRSEVISDQLYKDLNFIRVVYRKPLSISEKIRARNDLLDMYDKATSDVERQLVTELMEHFDLFVIT